MRLGIQIKIAHNGNMILSANKKVRNEFRKRMKDGETDTGIETDILFAIFENSEYDQCLPEWAGALTSAPMLGVFGEPRPLPEGVDPAFVNVVGHWEGNTWYEPLEQCWAFMNYAVSSITDELVHSGKCILQVGNLEPK